MVVSIIIVNYNTGDLLYNCLKSITENLTVDYQVIVADNASTDNSFSKCCNELRHERVLYLPLCCNYGFAKANNIAAAKATGEIFHFLNPDTVIDGRLNGDYLEIMEAPQHVYVNPLVNRDGSMENGAMPLPFIGNILRWNFNRDKALRWYKGASVIISAENFRRIGKWCEDYFMYAEDLDLFYTINSSGIKIKDANAPICHYGGGSTSAIWSSLERETIVQRSMRHFYRRHSNMLQYVAVKLYYLLHYLFKNPARVPTDISAWIKSYGKI